MCCIFITEWIDGKFRNLEMIFSGNLIADIFGGGSDVIKNSFYLFGGFKYEVQL